MTMHCFDALERPKRHEKRRVVAENNRLAYLIGLALDEEKMYLYGRRNK